MQVEVVRPGDLGSSEAMLWAKFQQGSPVTLNPFMSLTFAQSVGRVRSTARVAVVEENGKIGAFLPYELDAKDTARPIGWPMNDLQGFVGSDLTLDARMVVKKAGLRAWRFDHALADQAVLTPYHFRGTTSRSWEIDLSNGYESYLSCRSKSLKMGITRKRRNLERHLGTASLEWNSSDPRYFHQLIGWKTDQYRRTGVYELFSDPAALRIAEELSTSVSEDCRGVVSVLSVGERPVAIHFGIAGPSRLASWFPAYDRDLHCFSPGLIMWFALAEHASTRGVTCIDLGCGQSRYKAQVAVESYETVEGAVWVSRTQQVVQHWNWSLRNNEFLLRRIPPRARRHLGALLSNPCLEVGTRCVAGPGVQNAILPLCNE